MEKDGRRLDDEDGADEDADLDEDEEYLTRAERFEADYNFRFQARYITPLILCDGLYCR